MDLSESRRILADAQERLTGSHTQVRRLEIVLDALWRAASDGVVKREVFEPYLLKLRRYFLELEQRGSVALFWEKAPGKPLMSVTPIKRKIGALQKPIQAAAAPLGPIAPIDDMAPHCLLFIDAPNFYNAPTIANGIGHEHDGIRAFFRTRWEEMPQVVAELTKIPVRQQSCFLYTRELEGGSVRFKARKSAIQLEGIKVVTRKHKDTDLYLVTDMFVESLPYLTPERKLKIVLASGDSDYVYSLAKLRDLARERGTKIELVTLTWNAARAVVLDNLAHEWYSLIPFMHRIDPERAKTYSAKLVKMAEKHTSKMLARGM